jgi:hypothetical protein
MSSEYYRSEVDGDDRMPADPPELGWEEKTALIIGRASPEPSRRHIETVCTGAITEDGEVLRLYPIPLRYLEREARYRLWTWARFEVQKNPSDKRKESYKVREGSIQVLAEVKGWPERFALLQKAIIPDRETLDELYHKDWTSIGVVEIELINFYMQTRKKDWEKDKPYIKQFHLYAQLKPLEQLPIEMRLKFRCKNNPHCKTHESSLIGWQYMEAFRKFREKYGSGERAFEAMNQKLRSLFGDERKRAFALMGTHHRYGSWMVAELYFFDKNLPRRLF